MLFERVTGRFERVAGGTLGDANNDQERVETTTVMTHTSMRVAFISPC